MTYAFLFYNTATKAVKTLRTEDTGAGTGYRKFVIPAGTLPSGEWRFWLVRSADEATPVTYLAEVANGRRGYDLRIRRNAQRLVAIYNRTFFLVDGEGRYLAVGSGQSEDPEVLESGYLFSGNEISGDTDRRKYRAE